MLETLRACFDSLSGREDPAAHPAPRRPARGALQHLPSAQPSNERGESQVKKTAARQPHPRRPRRPRHGRLPPPAAEAATTYTADKAHTSVELRRPPHDVAGARLVHRFQHDHRQGRRQPRRLLGRLQDPGDVGQHRQRDARQAPAQRGLLLRREVPRDHLQEHQDREGLGHRATRRPASSRCAA